MAININRVIIVGRLGADPEQTSNGPVKMRIATSESWRNKSSGQREERTQWHSVVVWNEQAGRFAMEYIKKGDLVHVEGQLETRKWEKDDGTTQYITEVVVRPFTGSVQSQSQGGGGERQDRGERSQSRSSSGSGGQSRSGGGYGGGYEDDEIPF